MKVAIIGTRGIPNNYGGFEQFAQELSQRLVLDFNVQVSVYRDQAIYKNNISSYNGVNIINVQSSKFNLKILSQFIYDWNSIKDASTRNFDILLFCGHSTSFPGMFFLKHKLKSINLINPDGLEWKRKLKGLSFLVKIWNFFSEKYSLQLYDHIVSDNIGIKNYLEKRHGYKSTCIEYGVNKINKVESLKSTKYNFNHKKYDIIVARLVPENNIELMIKAYLNSNNTTLLVVVGKLNNKYGQFLKKNFSEYEKIKFIGGVYERKLLDNLILNARIYFHGHCVGGTNPSLLEAMNLKAHIIAHKNIFNESILNNNSEYFSSENDLISLINNYNKNRFKEHSKANFLKVQEKFTWNIITKKYFNLFKTLYNG
jgi:hypothetical protein